MKVAKKDGLVSVTARGVVGTLFWGAKAGEETSAFFNAGACAKGAKWRQCLLADPASVDARTPPGDCTLHLRDDAGSCTAWVPGCTPGLRASSEGPVDPDLAAALARIDVLEATVTSLQTDLADVNAAVMAAAAVKDTVDAHTVQLAELDTLAATVNGHTTSIDSLNFTVGGHTTSISSLNSTVGGNTASINSLNSMVGGHTTQLGTLASRTACISSKTGPNELYFEGCNLHILNGNGGTYSPKNGFGNLIIGYNENSSDTKDGSHNLVIGSGHSYTGWAGLVAGENNAIAGYASSVAAGQGNRATGNFSSVSGGSANLASANATSVGGGNENVASGSWASVSGGWKNVANGQYASVTGGQTNQAIGNFSSVSGGAGNEASGGASAVGGGNVNIANGGWAAVSGGWKNTASGEYASVSGGQENVAGGKVSSISGGVRSAASGEVSAVSGGEGNLAPGLASSVSGGRFNYAGGSWSSILGGRDNWTANGANGDGASIGGGLGRGNDTPHLFATGDGSFKTVTIASDRNTKEVFTPITPSGVLDKVLALPISEWEYKDEPGVRHVGPMAQDFRAAFQVGVTDKGIATVDADGVALAAIQGLHALVERQQQELERLSARLQDVCK